MNDRKNGESERPARMRLTSAPYFALLSLA
ncbi:hypothetical protein LMG26788_01150 [Achromobacter pulmonis]|uniref:Uncharacterized protein n=1 Tax=Achromobacter pulmonis TaxID=1389932 RepID=A0A6S7DN86_9BURK|nr:hypothetical protein LMG26788_01150 [Achromobacter pulmonis]